LIYLRVQVIQYSRLVQFQQAMSAATKAKIEEIKNELQDIVRLKKELQKQEGDLQKTLAALERGELNILPTDEAEREKRLKALRKKLVQIAALKKKGGVLDAEQQEKVDSEHILMREVAALEGGSAQIDVGPPNEHELHEKWLEQKHEIERKIKASVKKLSQINDLKDKASQGVDVHESEQAKIESESALKKEKHELEKSLGQLKKDDQMRMAERLGDDALKAHLVGGQKKKKNGP